MAKKRLRATTGLHYPADAESLRIVLKAGGFRNLTAEQRARVRIKEVAAGDWCDDMPTVSQAHQISRGHVEVVTDDPPRSRRRAQKE